VNAPPNLVNLPLLSGAQNFRAVKPYAASGRRLRPDTIFRSGELSRVTPADLRNVATLGIRLVCDLRSSAEQSAFPTSWPPGPAPAPRWLDLPDRDDSEAGPGAVFSLILSHHGDAGAAKAMEQMYRRKPRAFAETLRIIFQTVLAGGALPLLIHCHAGKDRTGFVTAMLLAALGIGKPDIIDDYITTAMFFPAREESIAIVDWARRAFGRKVDPAQASPLAEARASYIESAFAEIDTNWDGVDSYLREACSLTPEARASLQNLLLVSA
jgi:protein-tyrosine phosphatase